jgi:integrase
MPAVELEQEARIRQFQAELADGWAPDDRQVERGDSGVRHLLVRLRAVVRWGIGQRSPWLKVCPFHQYGVVISELDDTRARRLKVLPDGRTEEQALVAACRLLQDADHKFAGRALERRIVGALTLGGRGSDLDRVRLEHVGFAPAKGWPYVTFLGRARGGGKAKRDRRVPFNPEGPLAALLEARRFLRPPHDFVFGDEDGRIGSHYKAWTTARLLAHGLIRADGAGRTAAGDQALLREVDLQFRDLRRECASRWWDAGVRERRIQLLLGHATPLMTQRYLQLPEGEDTGEDVAAAMGWGETDPLATTADHGVNYGATTAQADSGAGGRGGKVAGSARG